MRALVFVYIIMEVAHAHAQKRNPLVVIINNWPRSCAKAVERDLLVTYLVKTFVQ